MSAFLPLTPQELVALLPHFSVERSYAYTNEYLQRLAYTVVVKAPMINELVKEFINHVRSCECWYCADRHTAPLDFIDYYVLVLFKLNGPLYVQMN